MIQTGRLVLASQSAARAGLLRTAGLAFETAPAFVDEAAVKTAAQENGTDAGEAALTLAGIKASRVRDAAALVIGADQILLTPGSGEWFSKPEGLAGARSQLAALRGRTHELATAVVCMRHGEVVWRHLARPRLTMRQFSDPFLDEYLAREGAAILGSVGAYRIEGPGLQLFERIEGEHTAIMGLPMPPLLGFLRQHGHLLA